LLQSLARRRDRLDPRAYGHLIVDEAHHVPAASFEQVLAAFAARYVAGLTATPVRRDGQHPIMQMQLGPIRWSARRAQARVAAPRVQIRRLQRLSAGAPGESIQSLMARLAREAARVTDLAQVVATLVDARRRVLVLTERTDHLDRLAAALASLPCPRIDLHGRLGRRARAQALADLRAIADDQPFVVLATGRLIGEGFDEARLDALVLAMPFSWKGTLQQYVGRLMRASPGKAVARVLDFEDVGVPMLERMAAKRRAGYRQLGCEVEHDDEREMRLALEGSVGPTSSVPQ
jgi:superfamily II DNA or RNA helicase